MQEFHWPFCDPLLFHVYVFSRLRLVDIFHLKYQRKRGFGTSMIFREDQRFVAICEWVIVIVAGSLIGRAGPWAAPDPVFKNSILKIPAAGKSRS
jgi:hypothetical protein